MILFGACLESVNNRSNYFFVSPKSSIKHTSVWYRISFFGEFLMFIFVLSNYRVRTLNKLYIGFSSILFQIHRPIPYASISHMLPY